MTRSGHFVDFLVANAARYSRDFPTIEIQALPKTWHRHGRCRTRCGSAFTIPKGNSSPSGIEAYGNLECAVNVPYGHNWLSTSSYFCNLGNTFRASVSWG